MNRLFFLILLALPLSACGSTTTPVGVGTPDGGEVPDGGGTDAPTGGTQCTQARDKLLLPIDKTSKGVVSIVSDVGGKKTIYVDASAGGLGEAAKSPRIYIELAGGTRISVTDKTAPESTEWDLSLKRSVIFTNSGDGGVGAGGAVKIPKAFASVTPADVAAATPVAEAFFDGDCNVLPEPTNAPLTRFADWYNYDQATNIPTPKPDTTYVVRGATGKIYKVGIKAYDALPDGGSRNNTSTGFYLLEVTEAAAQ